jgi:hypothetical protein
MKVIIDKYFILLIKQLIKVPFYKLLFHVKI